MSSSFIHSPFSLDLVEESKNHIVFLQKLHALGVSLKPPISSSLRRYRDFWLPLVVENAAHISMIPPSDVAWLWHCHRLAPYRYKEYVKKTFGDADSWVEANPPFSFQHEGDDCKIIVCRGSFMNNKSAEQVTATLTRDLWNEKYPSEPFFLAEGDDEMRTSPTLVEESFCGFDLVGSTERQAGFLWQVSGERFQEDAFLREGVSNYHRFLSLKKIAPNQVIVPTYQIDLMWHTHMLASIMKYDKDCRNILGSSLHHDDSLNDRSVGGTLDTAFQQTKKLWREQYGTEYSVFGGMYRGEPPEEYYSQDWGTRKTTLMSLPEGPLVGRVGASSSGTETSCGWLEASSNITTADTPFTTFIPGSYNAKQKKDYVYGRESQGVGYYHIYTREAYRILAKRISKAINDKQAQIARRKCLMTICCQKTPYNLRFVEENERKLDELRDMLQIVIHRMQANAPTGSLNARIPDEIRNDPARLERYNTYADPGVGYWYMPPVFYDAGGGCGSCPAGGGCGGGGCGGGGCGGGGCGGGGCGGGGCGG